jgi:hypothetical protein
MTSLGYAARVFLPLAAYRGSHGRRQDDHREVHRCRERRRKHPYGCRIERGRRHHGSHREEDFPQGRTVSRKRRSANLHPRSNRCSGRPIPALPDTEKTGGAQKQTSGKSQGRCQGKEGICEEIDQKVFQKIAKEISCKKDGQTAGQSGKEKQDEAWLRTRLIFNAPDPAFLTVSRELPKSVVVPARRMGNARAYPPGMDVPTRQQNQRRRPCVPRRVPWVALSRQVWYLTARSARRISVAADNSDKALQASSDDRLYGVRRFSSAVEQRFCKPKVGSSILSTGTI